MECVQLLEGCNVGNGYPYFVFVYRPKKNAAPMIVQSITLNGRVGGWNSTRRFTSFYSFPRGLPRTEADEIVKRFATAFRDARSKFVYAPSERSQKGAGQPGTGTPAAPADGAA